MKKIIITLIGIILGLLMLLVIIYLSLNYNHIKGKIMFPLGEINDVNIDDFNLEDLSTIVPSLALNKVRRYEVGNLYFTYYNSEPLSSLDLKKTNELSKIENIDVLIDNNIDSVYFDGSIYYFEIKESDIMIGYSKSTNGRLGGIRHRTRVDKIIDENWMLLRECNKYICGEEYEYD